MAINYAKELPRDKQGAAMQEFPAAVRPNARYASENATVSSVITLTDDTTEIEIGAQGNGAIMRWVTAGDTQASVVGIAGSTANFDHFVGSGTVRRFVVPIALSTVQASTVGINVQMGLFKRVAYRSTGIGSVLLSEY